MTLRPVPWGIGNGAENSVELARASHYNATSGATGVTESSDFVIKALPTPGAAVRAYKGGGSIKSTYPGVFGQSYSVQEDSYTDIPVAATGSASGAVKYVYVLIKDTQYDGQTPPSVEHGPYNEYAVTTTLPQNQPYLLLAQIDQPKSTATITNEMITDLREVANPIVGQFTFARPRISEDDGAQIKLTNRLTVDGVGPFWGEFFPGGAGVPNETRRMIPSRATHMSIRADWMGISVAGGVNSHGRYWIEFGDQYKAHGWPGGRQYEFYTQQFGFDTTGAGSNYKESWPLMDQVYIPKKLRGKEVTFVFKAGLNASASTAGITMAALGGLGMHVVFSMAPLDQDTI